MRAWFLWLALVGCTPDVASGSYLCGPEQLCPEGQSCDGLDGTCVFTNTQRPFVCDPSVEHEPDNTPQQGLAIASLACVSAPYVDNGCLAAGDDQDWVRFKVASGCVAVQVEGRVTFPVSWEPVGLELWDLDAMTMIGTGAKCKVAPASGDDASCITQMVTPSGTYGFKVKPAGGGDCAGSCNYNRYQLTVQLSTPG
ncbi:MAG: hypothetical protein JWO36_3219 [Myxococcales bacterium]|jgi:hypothetical protein|nr:hypothetical protein [Myxococcales bacterium]